MRLLRAGMALIAVPLASTGCVAGYCCFSVNFTGGVSSPAVYGVDFRAAPRLSLGASDATVHPMVAISKSLLGGVDGENSNTLHLGAQLRSAPLDGTPIWLGGEAAFARRWTRFDLTNLGSESANGWTLAALAGTPITGGLHGYIAGGLNHYGGTGAYGRLGLEIHH